MSVRVALRLGRWETVLHGVTCDALITDPPYSKRTQAGHNSAVRPNRVRAVDTERLRDDQRGGRYAVGAHRRKAIAYNWWTPEDVQAFVASWSPRTRGWFVAMTDHVLAPHWIGALEAAGRYVFSPLAYMATGSRVRLVGDGPAQWAVWIIVARPKTPEFARWGALPGGYVLPKGEQRKPQITGGKVPWLMRELVGDYSRPGDVVCDPCAGAGTTLREARALGRHAIGAEQDPATHALALDLLHGRRPEENHGEEDEAEAHRVSKAAVQAHGRRARAKDPRPRSPRAGRSEAKGRKEGRGAGDERGLEARALANRGARKRAL